MDTLCKVIIIAGTGRAGTTFLMEHFTNMGAPTGFQKNSIKEAQAGHSHGGLEKRLPPLVNGQFPCSSDRSIFKDISKTANWTKCCLGASNVDTVIVPIRSATGAAHSRHVEHVLLKGRRGREPAGGFFRGAQTESEQLFANAKIIYDLVYDLSNANIRVIFLAYPRHVKDAEYAYSALKHVLDNLNIGKEMYFTTYNLTYRPEFVHEY